MLVFVGPSELTVNHINGIKCDNSLENLEYLSVSDNNKHAYRTGLKCCAGEKHHLTKLRQHDVLEIRRLCEETDLTLREVGYLYDLTISGVFNIKSRRSWKHLK